MSRKPTHPALGWPLSLIVVAFAIYTLRHLDQLMVAMDHWAGITP